MKYIHLFADEFGESHFEDCELVMVERDYAPPANPLLVSEQFPATAFKVLVPPVGWVGDWHPVPRRQWLQVLSGTMDMAVSDGEVRSIKAGDLLLAEDTGGRGHHSTNTGGAPLIVAAAVCAESVP